MMGLRSLKKILHSSPEKFYSSGTAAMKYYKTDSRKISFGEYWHLSPKQFWVAWLNKILGRQMNFIRGIPEPQPFKIRLVEANTVPPTILGKLNSGVQDLEKIGFDQFWYCAAIQFLGGGMAHSVVSLHASRQIIAKVLYVSYAGRESFIFVFFSSFGGTILATTNKREEFRPLPKHIVQRQIDAGAPVLLALHQHKMLTLGTGDLAQSFAGLDEVAAFDDALIQATYEDKIKRGIWVEMTEPDVAALRAVRSTAFVIPQA
jgi:hypothetical protein